MIEIDDEQLTALIQDGSFPIYLYWDETANKFYCDKKSQLGAVGCIWKNPFEKTEDFSSLSKDETVKEVCLRVNAVIMKTLDSSETEVIPTADLIWDLGANSLDVIEVVMMLEKEFDIHIPNTVIESLRTVADFQHLCVQELSEKAAKETKNGK